ncbi:3-hydroxy-3-methylglutaryl-coenzyme A reductase [Archaeoglobus sulfaticallidus PM70-1]|uniref:3-hydroxy-3-methylglutaryl-coenzyme A reductase n=1 Tax=Archaeoglobus sulfaticallidus PM70-1 TaxID=387631 RepID=N0BN62_9EURY|nr:hydroxymethylglutaryl-CoA reductase, degradative [Archaeoglobus sulfaticallidus]AGK62046.1 3-hydroxy-3-methylglutaryl-coenzyme A reductase [Archaeoglobus sulfaticallidus PM70-1]
MASEKSSRIEGFYKLPIEKRLKKVVEFSGLSDEEAELLKKTGSLSIDIADRMIENVIGTFELPIGIATNFLIDGKDYLIPMVIEEPSVVAAASNAAKMARVKGGFWTSSTGPLMIGQVQVTNLPNPNYARLQVLAHKDEIIEKANEQDPMLVSLGGGCKDIEARVIDTMKGKMLIIHLIVDVRDAMGANAVNTMAEAVAPLIEKITGGRVYLRIISNLAVYRLARAYAIFDKDAIGGEEVVEGIMNAYAFALADPFRCATHNKGIMNGISAVVLATGNDFRAIEAGAHAYASLNGYKPLTTYEVNSKGDLVGTIEVPVAVGVIGGSTSVNPLAKINLKILGVKSADELSRIIAAVGLAQNFAALRALATEGIQRGHMSLHARNIAISAGAKGDEIDKVVEVLVRERKIRMDRAMEILKEIRSKKG